MNSSSAHTVAEANYPDTFQAVLAAARDRLEQDDCFTSSLPPFGSEEIIPGQDAAPKRPSQSERSSSFAAALQRRLETRALHASEVAPPEAEAGSPAPAAVAVFEADGPRTPAHAARSARAAAVASRPAETQEPLEATSTDLTAPSARTLRSSRATRKTSTAAMELSEEVAPRRAPRTRRSAPATIESAEAKPISRRSRRLAIAGESSPSPEPLIAPAADVASEPVQGMIAVEPVPAPLAAADLPAELQDCVRNLPTPRLSRPKQLLTAALDFGRRLGATASRPSRKLRVVESVSLGEKRFAAVLDVEGRRFLIGGGASGVSLLTSLDLPAPQTAAPQQSGAEAPLS